jgi:hypothetical protein
MNISNLKQQMADISRVQMYIQAVWKTTDPNRFPGPQPISIERRHFPWLKCQPYVVCEKTDGVRHMLVCPPGSKESFLVNRNFEIKSVILAGFPKDTILDGELVMTKDKSQELFMVYDAVRAKGVDLMREPLTTRLGFAIAAAKAIIKSKRDMFEVRVKTMIPLEAIANMEPLDSFEYETDGIVMTPINEPIRTGTHETLFKWKPFERITVDFTIQNGKELWVQEHGTPFFEAELHVSNQRPDLANGTVVECGYGDLGWFVEKVRLDKNYANNRRTYYNTCTNLRERIELNEFGTL